MDLTTSCPRCAHIFRVSLSQLQLRKGYVRCEECSHIFDGYEAVVPDSGGDQAPQPSLTSRQDSSQATPQPVVPSVRTAIPYPFRRPADLTASHMPESVSIAKSFAPNQVPPVARTAPSPPNGVIPSADPVLPSVVRHRVSSTATPPVSRDRDFTISSSAASERPEPLIPAPGRDAGSRSSREHFVLDESGPSDIDFRLGRSFHGDNDFRSGDEFEDGGDFQHAGDFQDNVDFRDVDDAGDDDGRTSDAAAAIYIEPRPDIGRQTRPPAFLNERATLAQRVMRVVWGTLALVAVACALLFLAYIYRVQIANGIPALRPLLENACVSLKCQVPYARRIDLIQITKSSLKTGSASDAAEGPNAMILEINLRNSYDRPQEWPALVLDLTDFSGATVVRRELRPQTYLSPDVLQQPFAASSEVLVRVPINPKNVKINGYQLSKYYP